eukprot:14874216-Ditylum_brightwellii.AAC.1
MTRSRPVPVSDNKIQIPSELLSLQEEVTLSMDGLLVNGLKFLTTISHDIYYQTLQYVKDPIALVYEQCINEVKTLYNKG